MRTILKIAGHELKLLFCSPVAWLLLVILLYQFGDAFAGCLGNPAEALALYPGYTGWLFSGNIFPGFDRTIYLYIPLLTMGLMSNELSSGSIKLLFSAPVKTRDIVLGKYLGIVSYWLIAIILFCLFIISAWLMIPNMDLGIILPGVLAVFLLVCTYSAIGLFMSCLTSYQVVAALSTLTALAALNYIGNMWQGVPVLKDIVNFLDMSGHAEHMNAGFIKSRDILYFIIMTLLFLGLAIFHLEDSIQFRSRTAKLGRYVVFTVVMLSLGCLSSLRVFTAYFDTTAIQSNTISTSSQEILKKIKGPVAVTAYSNLLKGDNGVGAAEQRMKDFNFWEPYIRFLPQLELKYVNYYDWQDHDPAYATAFKLDSAATQQAARYGWYVEDFLKPGEIRKMIDLKPEGVRFVRTIEQGNKRRWLRVFNDFGHVPAEREIITAFNGLLTSYPRIGFLSGHYERNIDHNEDRDYKKMINEGSNRAALINQGFDVQTVSVTGNIPDDIDALIIAEPQTTFNAEELEKLKAYIEKGGNLLVTGGPKSQAILNPLVTSLGVHFMDGQLIQWNPDFSDDLVFTHTPLREGGDPNPFQFTTPIAMPASIGLQYKTDTNFNVEEAVITDEESTWNKMGEISVDTGRIAYQPKDGDTHDQLPVALTLTRNIDKKEQRIMVLGNADFISNENLDKDYRPLQSAHIDFAISVFKWLGSDRYPLIVAPRLFAKDIELAYTPATFEKYKLYYTWLLPVLVFIWGLISLWRRRRK